MYCAWCGTQVPVVSYDPCPRCGKPTNGAERAALTAVPAKSNTAIIIVVLAVVFGVILVMGGIVAAIAIPNLIAAKERANQKRTMADIRMIGTALDAFDAETNSYPQVQSYDQLTPLLVPKYIRTMPQRDAWGHPFRYACTKTENGNCTGYAIGSAGKDGVFAQDLPAYVAASPGATTNFDCDLIFSDGSFIQYPEGVQH